MKDELAQTIRFLITGAGIAVIYISTFAALAYSGVSPFFTNLVAFTLSVIVQYVVQTMWTFKRPLIDGAQTVRFFTIIGVGLIYSSFVAVIVGPALDWSPAVVGVIICVSLPIINFLSFRFWVYGKNRSEGV